MKGRNKLMEAMRRFPERFIPDKRQKELQAEADAVIAEVFRDTIATGGRKFDPACTYLCPIHGTAGKVINMEATQFLCEAAQAPHVYTIGDATIDDSPHISTNAAVEGETLLAASSALTPEELAALKPERTADPMVCPNCHTGFASGRGWHIGRDHCGACDYRGKRALKIQPCKSCGEETTEVTYFRDGPHVKCYGPDCEKHGVFLPLAEWNAA